MPVSLADQNQKLIERRAELEHADAAEYYQRALRAALQALEAINRTIPAALTKEEQDAWAALKAQSVELRQSQDKLTRTDSRVVNFYVAALNIVQDQARLILDHELGLWQGVDWLERMEVLPQGDPRFIDGVVDQLNRLNEEARAAILSKSRDLPEAPSLSRVLKQPPKKAAPMPTEPQPTQLELAESPGVEEMKALDKGFKPSGRVWLSDSLAGVFWPDVKIDPRQMHDLLDEAVRLGRDRILIATKKQSPMAVRLLKQALDINKANAARREGREGFIPGSHQYAAVSYCSADSGQVFEAQWVVLEEEGENE